MSIVTNVSVIRPAVEEDVPHLGVVDLMLHAGSDPSDVRRFVVPIRENRMLVCAEGEQIHGYLRWVLLWGTTPMIELLRVRPEFQRNEVASRLLDELVRGSRRAGHTMLLSSTRTNNHATIEMHRALGFEHAGYLELGAGKPSEVLFRRLLD